MDEKVRKLLINVEKNHFIWADQEFNSIIESFDFKFPESYISVMKDFNGGEGEIGSNSWVFLFPVEELDQINKDYDLLMSEIPDFFLFGKDAADTGYAFHKIKGTFHSFGLMSNFETDSIEFLGNDFVEFLEYLENNK